VGLAGDDDDDVLCMSVLPDGQMTRRSAVQLVGIHAHALMVLLGRLPDVLLYSVVDPRLAPLPRSQENDVAWFLSPIRKYYTRER
jgi:hypothetical protein